MQATIELRIGGEPPVMSFAAHKPTEVSAPSVLNRPQPPSQPASCAVPGVTGSSEDAAHPDWAGLHDAPRQGVWYNGSPSFEGNRTGSRPVGEAADGGADRSSFVQIN